MKKRVIASVLWFYAAWYGWSIVADIAGLPVLLGPAVGLAVAAFVGLDPMHRIWTRRSESTRASVATLEPETA